MIMCEIQRGADPLFDATFRGNFTKLMSQAATVPQSNVVITSIESGSTEVASTVLFSASDIAAGAGATI